MSAQDTLFDVAAAMPAETLSLLRDAVERAIAEETGYRGFLLHKRQVLDHAQKGLTEAGRSPFGLRP